MRLPDFAYSFFILFYLALLIYLLGHPIYRYWQATRTVYALTDQRALILKPTFGSTNVASYPTLERVERTSLAGNRGDLVFATETYITHERYYRRATRKIGFFGIPDVRRVEELMLENIPTAQSRT